MCTQAALGNIARNHMQDVVERIQKASLQSLYIRGDC